MVMEQVIGLLIIQKLINGICNYWNISCNNKFLYLEEVISILKSKALQNLHIKCTEGVILLFSIEDIV